LASPGPSQSLPPADREPVSQSGTREEGTGTLPPVTDQTRETPQKKEEEEKNKTPLDILQEKADRFQLEKERERDEEEERRKAPVGGEK